MIINGSGFQPRYLYAPLLFSGLSNLIWDYETASNYIPWRPIEPGDAGDEFCIFDILGKERFGICVCYDVWFPEVARNLAWMGAEAIFCPTATYTSDRSQEMVLVQAAAISNQLFFLNVNGLV